MHTHLQADKKMEARFAELEALRAADEADEAEEEEEADEEDQEQEEEEQEQEEEAEEEEAEEDPPVPAQEAPVPKPILKHREAPQAAAPQEQDTAPKTADPQAAAPKAAPKVAPKATPSASQALVQAGERAVRFVADQTAKQGKQANSLTHKAQWNDMNRQVLKQGLQPPALQLYRQNKLDFFQVFLEKGCSLEKVTVEVIRRQEKSTKAKDNWVAMQKSDMILKGWSEARIENVISKRLANGQWYPDHDEPENEDMNWYWCTVGSTFSSQQKNSEALQGSHKQEMEAAPLLGAGGALEASFKTNALHVNI